MTPEEFAIARGKLGWSDEKLAAELQVAPKVVRAWADGTLQIPKHDAQTIAWEAAAAERHAALEASGIHECGWVKAWEAEPLPKRAEAIQAHFKRLKDHADHCALCQERERFIRERFPEMPEFPKTPLMSGFAVWDRFLQGFPEWTHPVFNGAGIITALVAIRVLFVLPRQRSWTMLVALGVGAALGAVGGLTYSALRPYIAAGGARKILAYLLVLATYLTLPAVFGAYGDTIGFSVTGTIVLLSEAGLVVILWLLGRRKTT